MYEFKKNGVFDWEMDEFSLRDYELHMKFFKKTLVLFCYCQTEARLENKVTERKTGSKARLLDIM